MKLNKNGWGYLEFFAFLAIFVICLVIAALGLRQAGLIDENFQFVKFKNNEEKKENYPELREQMVDATMKYISKYYNNDLGIDTLNIRVSQLKNEGLINEFKDHNGKECSGYVSVYLDDSKKIQYNAYLKCKNFETEGYEKRKDD